MLEKHIEIYSFTKVTNGLRIWFNIDGNSFETIYPTDNPETTAHNIEYSIGQETKKIKEYIVKNCLNSLPTPELELLTKVIFKRFRAVIVGSEFKQGTWKYDILIITKTKSGEKSERYSEQVELKEFNKIGGWYE